ncbi:gamma-glutamylcyclotransferase family protein [Brevibacillus sp. H7]|uniref:gamma-glutamylcyclotransferase family protein n=1 Tax=Brevibacillus sp. H7 TaxID=3349138 RepID=UPI00380B2603
MNKRMPVFVYGSLRAGFENHRLYVQPYPHHVQKAAVRGRLYHLPSGYPGLLLEDEGWVSGELIFFADGVYAEVMSRLDKLETFYGPGDPRNEYERVIVEATLTETSESIRAYAYLYVDEAYAKRKGICVPDGDWREFIRTR